MHNPPVELEVETYSAADLEALVTQRLKLADVGELFEDKAIKTVANKVAATSGDARRMLGMVMVMVINHVLDSMRMTIEHARANAIYPISITDVYSVLKGMVKAGVSVISTLPTTHAMVLAVVRNACDKHPNKSASMLAVCFYCCKIDV